MMHPPGIMSFHVRRALCEDRVRCMCHWLSEIQCLWQMDHHAQPASSSSQSPASQGGSSGQLHLSQHLRHMGDSHGHLQPEAQFASRRLPHSRSHHRDMNGGDGAHRRRSGSSGGGPLRGGSPPGQLPKPHLPG